MPSLKSSRAVRAAVLAAAAGVSFALYAQSMNLRPGLYEFTNTSDLQLPPDVAAKMPPQYLAMMQKPHVSQHCISQSDVDAVSREIAQGKPDQPESCKVTERSISGSVVKFTTQCAHSTGHFEGTFAAESFQGTMVSTTDKGQTVSIRIAARRVGDCSK
ncbi:MAG TPA: DUF3617 domain-containing protein [Steroidobacteraceae bacterium]|nr:DUF3617 domain-containing protein [Steroidobacteraceae bacterium]